MLLRLTSRACRDLSIFAGRLCDLHLRGESRRASANAQVTCASAIGHGIAGRLEIACTAIGVAVGYSTTEDLVNSLGPTDLQAGHPIVEEKFLGSGANTGHGDRKRQRRNPGTIQTPIPS